MTDHRVLVIEQIAVDRFHRGIALPFVRGFLLAEDLSNIRWLRFGHRATARASHQGSGVPLASEDLRKIDDVVQTLRPTHVLCHPTPSEELLEALSALAPAPAIGFFDDLTDPGTAPRGAEWLETDELALRRFFELAEASPDSRGRHLFRDVLPSFDWERGNDLVDEALPLPFLVCGAECTYRRSVTDRAAFRDLELPPGVRRRGCTFCAARRDTSSRWRVDAVELFRRQLGALLDSHPPWSGRLAIRVLGEPALRHVEAFARSVLDLDAPPLSLLLDGRADEILRQRDAINAALGLLETSAHRLQMCLVGVESFVDEELELFNKGLDGRTNLEAISALLELELAHPAHFDAREHGGFSLVLMTPWTRPEDLAFNLAILRGAHLGDRSGKALTSRLRLDPKSPLAVLAERDGLVLDHYDDPLLDTARRNFYPDEVPWRFAAPSMEPLGRVMVRLDARGDADDELTRRIEREVVGAGHGAQRSLDAASALVDAAIEIAPTSAEELLDSLRARGTARRGIQSAPVDPAPACCRGEQADATEWLEGGWGDVATRLGATGAMEPLLHPGVGLVTHRFCSPTCAASMELARARFEALPEAERSRVIRASKHPWLLFVESGALLELVTEAEPSGTLRIVAGEQRGEDPLLYTVRGAEELVVGEQRLLARREGRTVASLGGRAFLWWHRAPVQAELWSALLEIRGRAGQLSVTSEADEPRRRPAPALARLHRIVGGLLLPKAGAPRPLGSFTTRDVAIVGEELHLGLVGAGGRRLRIGVRLGGERSEGHLRAGPVACFLLGDASIDADARRALRDLAARLESAFTARRRR